MLTLNTFFSVYRLKAVLCALDEGANKSLLVVSQLMPLPADFLSNLKTWTNPKTNSAMRWRVEEQNVDVP